MMMVGITMTVVFIMGVTPYVMRKNLHFGVMLPDRASELPEVKQWKKRFLRWSIGLGIAGILPLFLGFFMNLDEEALTNYIGIVGAITIVVIAIIHIILYFNFHNQAKALKAERFSAEEIKADARIMVSTRFRNEKMIVSNRWLMTVGGLIIAVTALLPVIFYHQIPDIVPVNWNSSVATAFRPRSHTLFLIIPAFQLGMFVIFIFVNYSLKATKQMLRPKNAKASLEQNRAYRYAQSKMIVAMGIGLLLIASSLQITMMIGTYEFARFMIWPIILYSAFPLISIIYIAFKYGQGGERYNPVQTADNDYDHDIIDDDAYWKWGMIYYNPNDPAIFIEKRFGIGTTVNFARWQAWAMLFGILAFTAIITIASVMMVQ